jgi:hypothetical protein
MGNKQSAAAVQLLQQLAEQAMKPPVAPKNLRERDPEEDAVPVDDNAADDLPCGAFHGCDPQDTQAPAKKVIGARGVKLGHH